MSDKIQEETIEQVAQKIMDCVHENWFFVSEEVILRMSSFRLKALSEKIAGDNTNCVVKLKEIDVIGGKIIFEETRDV